MLGWQLRWVRVPPQAAANEPWPVFTRKREVTVTRSGPYTRVVLTKRAEPIANR